MNTIDCRRKSTKVVDHIVEKVEIISEQITAPQIEFVVKKLATHPLFCTLSSEELEKVCSDMVHVKAKKDEYLFLQGDAGHCFFVVEKGRVDVEVQKKVVNVLGEGQAFGQLALLFRAPRAASIIPRGE